MTNPSLLKPKSRKSEKDLASLIQNRNHLPNLPAHHKRKKKPSLSQEYSSKSHPDSLQWPSKKSAERPSKDNWMIRQPVGSLMWTWASSFQHKVLDQAVKPVNRQRMNQNKVNHKIAKTKTGNKKKENYKAKSNSHQKQCRSKNLKKKTIKKLRNLWKKKTNKTPLQRIGETKEGVFMKLKMLKRKKAWESLKQGSATMMICPNIPRLKVNPKRNPIHRPEKILKKNENLRKKCGRSK